MSAGEFGAVIPPALTAFMNDFVVLGDRGVCVRERLSTQSMQNDPEKSGADYAYILYPSANVFFGPDPEFWFRWASGYTADARFPGQFAVAFGGSDFDVSETVPITTREFYSYVGMLMHPRDGNVFMQITGGYSFTNSFTPVGGSYDAFVPYGRPLLSGLVDDQNAIGDQTYFQGKTIVDSVAVDAPTPLGISSARGRFV